MFSIDGYQAFRHAAGVVRRGDRGILRVGGADRLTWLQGLLTNDVAALPIGGVCEAAYLTPQGRMITDARVINLAQETLLDVPASLAEALRAKLDTLLFSEDAQIANVSDTLAIVDVHGPDAPRIIARLDAELAAEGVTVARHDAFNLPGFSLLVLRATAERVVALLTGEGAVETTLETLDVIRIEAGRPAFLIDMNDHTLPLEAGIEDRAISFTKGCYVGQEVIVRVLHRGGGRVAKKLVGIQFSGGQAPHAGHTILAGEREIGQITSAAWSPTLERAVALGYVHRDFVEAGTAVRVRVDDTDLSGVVTPLPFVGGVLPSAAPHP